MSKKERQANIGQVLAFLRQWDRGDRTVRRRMLNTFLSQNAGKSFHELELEFAQVASLFLARLTTWMRLTYMFGTLLELQLKAIGIFLCASNHDQYLMEFLQDGGVLTLLEILSHSQSKEGDKSEALRLLLTVSNAGRKYKEIICESHGVRVIAECLARSNTEEIVDTSCSLLETLFHGNPKHQNKVYKTLIALMTCTFPHTQHLILHTLRTVQSQMKTVHPSLVELLLNMLRSLHFEVQDEAISLIIDLRSYDVRPVLLNELVALLKPNDEEMQQQQDVEDLEVIMTTGSLPAFLQQAAAAKTIRLLAKDSEEISFELLSLGVIQHLLFALGNREHTDAQIQASLALEHFVRSYPVIGEHVQQVIGETLFVALMHNADSLYVSIDEAQAEILLTNKVNISEVLKCDKVLRLTR